MGHSEALENAIASTILTQQLNSAKSNPICTQISYYIGSKVLKMVAM